MGQCDVMTNYWKHANYTDLCRMTTVVQKHDGSVVNYALAQYYFTGEPHKVSPKKNRCKKPFPPTTPSTFQVINEMLVVHQGVELYLIVPLKKQEE